MGQTLDRMSTSTTTVFQIDEKQSSKYRLKYFSFWLGKSYYGFHKYYRLPLPQACGEFVCNLAV